MDFRNVLAHGYALVDDEVVWEAIDNNVPELARIVAELLGESHG